MQILTIQNFLLLNMYLLSRRMCVEMFSFIMASFYSSIPIQTHFSKYYKLRNVGQSRKLHLFHFVTHKTPAIIITHNYELINLAYILVYVILS